MYFVYIIESERNGRWYIGSSDDPIRRLGEHNRGTTTSTKPYVPYRLIYTEALETKTDALKREHAIKRSGVIRKELKVQLKNMASSSNG